MSESEASQDAARALREAWALLHRRPHGALATMARSGDGGPFGSVVPYALDERARPLLYVARIAEHRNNMRKDPRVSLLVHHEPEGRVDVQEGARICVMGRGEPVPEAETEDAWRRYRARVPAAVDYAQTHGFELWRIEPSRLRWIGGFGDIRWLSVEGLAELALTDPVRAAAAPAVAHMNEDHLDAIEDFYAAFRGQRPSRAWMVNLDAGGMDLDAEDLGPLRVGFGELTTPEGIRASVVGALQKARARLQA